MIKLFLALVVLCVLAQPSYADFSCANGAVVDIESRCKFFAAFSNDDAEPDPRLRLRLHVKSGVAIRSIALIVSISKYKYIKDVDVSSASRDAEKLAEFLIKDQKFDEVIIIKDEEVTFEVIDYFSRIYAPKIGDQYNGKSRFLFAYSGHGVQISGSTTTGLVLSDAKTSADTSKIVELRTLHATFATLAEHHFHVLALINACYGGGLFSWAPAGGNPSNSSEAGAYAVTAGPEDQLVYSLGGQNDGSIFFDNIIEGIKTGDADKDYPVVQNEQGEIVQMGGIVRLGSLVSYLTGQIERLNTLPPAKRGNKIFAAPFVGPIEDRVARGAFFFLSPVRAAPGSVARLDIPSGPISSLPEQPELKIFNAPSEYPVRGIDVSRYNGQIDWNSVARSGIDFAYIRAVVQGASAIEPAFVANWESSRSAGIRRGAYIPFSFCISAQQQFRGFQRVVKIEPGVLPPVIDVEYPVVGIGPEIACSKKPPQVIRGELLKLARMLHQEYRKIPVIYGGSKTFDEIVNDEFNDYTFWLARYAAGPSIPRLRGNKTWTIWQYSDKERISGINGGVDGNVFFSTRERFEKFASGTFNANIAKANQEEIKNGSP